MRCYICAGGAILGIRLFLGFFIDSFIRGIGIILIIRCFATSAAG
jgi:hypothetical protein